MTWHVGLRPHDGESHGDDHGNDGNDVLRGTNDADSINGLGGDDTLEGHGGADRLDGVTRVSARAARRARAGRVLPV